MTRAALFITLLICVGSGLGAVVWAVQLAANNHDELIRQQTIEEVCK